MDKKDLQLYADNLEIKNKKDYLESKQDESEEDYTVVSHSTVVIFLLLCAGAFNVSVLIFLVYGFIKLG